MTHRGYRGVGYPAAVHRLVLLPLGIAAIHLDASYFEAEHLIGSLSNHFVAKRDQYCQQHGY